MTRWLAFPLLTLCLLAMWLLLVQSVAPGSILMGVLVALVATRLFTVLRPEPVKYRLTGAVVRLAGIVLYDIIRSNIAVARIILTGRTDRGMSGFIRIPIDMRSRHGLALLAVIITATPGTLWVQFDSARGSLLIHVLDLVDEEQWIALIKNRYEKLLMEIFP
ncbi:cation:proton antiporter [Sphingobium jiangsuense]|uniref:Multicomponent K+:H+ antiporter subunit E n=1 Tax=Sphingobium jiangsuense TaxID=870476 RepID=A0A7W6BKX2_9SPHN|nr:Na+/H+ antiporter subunit E [Sphingobium jiangsuense]MBB3925600.1 multicomponent K+:H+ antiporter subunit E [Sphingobium jiangsuense]GLS99808.1 cation:proton antiporter [Sphingobium jiangsuense]